MMAPEIKRPTADDAKKVLGYLPVHVVITAITWWDINRRPDEAIRGDKRMWKILSALNTGNSLAYWIFGRKRSTR